MLGEGESGTKFRFRRPVSPYISSTLQDFQTERDVLVNRVFPAVDALCRQRGTYCAPIDLRWDKKESVTSQSGVLRLCLDHVTQCCPFFLCLLGERYGLHRPKNAKPLPPSMEDLPAEASWLDRNFLEAASGGHEWLTQETFQQLSITELEVMQALQVAEAEHMFFYFRQPDHVDLLLPGVEGAERHEQLAVYEADSTYGNTKVRDLKARIVKRGQPVRYFKSPDELARLALDDWMTLVDRLYPPLHHGVGRTGQALELAREKERFAELVAHETLAETRRQTFVRTPEADDIMAEMTEFAASCLDAQPADEEYRGERETFKHSRRTRHTEVEVTEPRVFVLVGDRGSGKTSLVADWEREFSAEYSDVRVICHHVGASARSADICTLLRHCAEDLRGETLTDWRDVTTGAGQRETADLYALTEQFRAALSHRPCLLILDGLDELSGSYGLSPQQLKELSWLPLPLPAQCRVVMTTVPSDVTYRVLERRSDVRMVHMNALSDPDVRAEILEEHANTQCRYVSSSHIDQMVGCKLAERPLFLAILAHELRVLGVSPRVEQHLEGYLEAASVRDLWGRVIRRWVQDYSWNVYNPLAAEDEPNSKTKGFSGWVADALRLIAVSKDGLSQSEILSVLGALGYHGQREVTSFDWAQFRWAAQGVLFEGPGGLMSFSHQHLKEAVEYTLLGVVTPCSQPRPCAVTPDLAAVRDPKARLCAAPGGKAANLFLGAPYAEPASAEPTQRAFHQHLATFFTARPPSRRRTEELPWQLEMCGNMDDLRAVLSEPRVFLELHGDEDADAGRSGRRDLFHYWTVLSRAGHDASDAYRQMVRLVVDRRALTPQNSMTDTDQPDDYREPEAVSQTDDIEERESVSQADDIGGSERVSQADDIGERESVSRAESCATSAFDLYAPLVTEDLSDHQKARLYRVVAMFLSELGHTQSSEELLAMAYNKLYESYPLGDDAQRLLCSVETELAGLYFRSHDTVAARKWYSKALLSLESLMEGVLDPQLVSKHNQVKGRLLDQLGHLAARDGDHGQAEVLLRRAEESMSRALCVRGKASVHHHLGSLRLARGQFVEAEMMFRQAITTRERLYGASHPSVADVLDDLAGLLCHPDNKISYERYEAEALYRRALRIREVCLGPDHLHMATTLFHLGKLLSTDGASCTHRGESLQLLRRSIDIRTTKLGADHPDTLEVRRVLSALEVAAGGRQAPSSEGGRATTARHTAMTWHDEELLFFQQRERAKAAHAARLKAQQARAPSRQAAGSRGLGGGDPRRRPMSELPAPSARSWDVHAPPGHTHGGSVESLPQTRRGVVSEASVTLKSLSVDDLHSTRAGELHVEFPNLDAASPREEEAATAPHRANNGGVRAGKPRPLSSYGRRSVPLTSVKFAQPHHQPALKVAPPGGTQAAVTSSGYVESYAPSRTPSASGSRSSHVQAKIVLRIARPRTDPNTLYNRYATSTGSTPNSSTESPEHRPHRRQSTVASRAASRSLSFLPSGTGVESVVSGGAQSSVFRLHRQHCYIPGRHTNDIHNAYSSTKGPNSSLLSLLGDPSAPRDVFLQVHHKSAWYHVPGRYGTVDRPYPPKRCQRRPGSEAERGAGSNVGDVRSLHGATGVRTNDDDDVFSQHSWDSRNSFSIGAGGGGGAPGMLESWMT